MQPIRRVDVVGYAVLLILVFSEAAQAHGGIFQAYIDPGTGSFIVQILLAGLVGASFAVGVFWSKIKSFFSRIFYRK
ncbi:MAG: hypothetical protein ACYTFK_07750 [Planctomycetota bacterium]